MYLLDVLGKNEVVLHLLKVQDRYNVASKALKQTIKKKKKNKKGTIIKERTNEEKKKKKEQMKKKTTPKPFLY